MDADEQKEQITESKFSERHNLNASHVFPSIGLRHFIQDALKLHWELLGHRYHILLLIRGILAILLGSIEVF